MDEAQPQNSEIQSIRLRENDNQIPPQYTHRLHNGGAGDCLFRAIAQAEYHGDETAFQGIKNNIIGYLQSKTNNIFPVFPPGYVIPMGINDDKRTEDVDEYIAELDTPGYWGGEQELILLALILNKKIYVKDVFGRVKSYSPPNPNPEPIYLYHSGAHWELLVPVGTQNTKPIPAPSKQSSIPSSKQPLILNEQQLINIIAPEMKKIEQLTKRQQEIKSEFLKAKSELVDGATNSSKMDKLKQEMSVINAEVLKTNEYMAKYQKLLKDLLGKKGGGSNIWREKYLKYKAKYLALKNGKF